MELNDNATTHLADKEIVIPTTIAPGHPKTLPDTVTSRTSNRTKSHQLQDNMTFYGERHLKSRGQ